MQSQRLDVFSRGADNYLWQAWSLGGTSWTWFKITDGAGVSRQMASTASAVSWAPGRLDVFFRGPDHHLWQAWWQGGNWNWFDLGGDIASAPSAVSRGVGYLDIFATGPSNVLFNKRFDYAAGGWQPWAAITGVSAASAPAAVSWGSNRLDVFVRGGDNRLWQAWWQGVGWTWYQLGGYNISSPPAAASRAPAQVTAFARSQNGTLVSANFTGAWTFTDHGGTVTLQPGAEGWQAFGTSRTDAFVRWTDSSLRQKYYNGTWQPWDDLGSGIASAPAAVSWGANRIDAFARGPTNTLKQIWWQNPIDWTWEDLGSPPGMALHSGC
jgi:hypothetical protein